MVLSQKQREELNLAIVGYLRSLSPCAALSAELEPLLGLSGPIDSKYNDMLEKKWSSIIRLQKRILELENSTQQLKEDLNNTNKGNYNKIDISACLPRDVCKYELKGHRDLITAVKFHPIYNLLASSSEDATIKFWDFESGLFERSLQGHQDAVNDIDFTPNGNFLVSASSDLSIKVWDVSDNHYECVKTLQGHEHTISSVQFFSNGDFIASASRDKQIKIWELSTGYCIRSLSGHDQWVRRVCVHPNNALIVSCSMDQSIRFWDINKGECIKVSKDHEHVVECIAFSNHLADQYLITAIEEENKSNPNNPQSSYNSQSQTPLAILAHMNNSNNESSSSSSQAENSSNIHSQPSSSAISSAASATPIGANYVVSGSRDKTIRVWETATGNCVKTLIGHDNWVRGVLFHPSGRFIISCSDDKSICCWDISKQFRLVKRIAAHDLFVTAIHWNTKLPLLASAAVDHTIKVWEARPILT